MSAKQYDHASVKRILIITLSNLGDVVLSLPVLDSIKQVFPDANVSVIVGKNMTGVFDGNLHVNQVIAFDKRLPLKDKFRWMMAQRSTTYDIIIDLRNSLMPFFLKGKYKTFPEMIANKNQHMRLKHLNRLRSVVPQASTTPAQVYGFYTDATTITSVDKSLEGINHFVLIAPGAKSGDKCWPKKSFVKTCEWLINRGERIVFVGDDYDKKMIDEMMVVLPMRHIVSLAGKTDLKHLPEICRRAKVCLVNDSGIMHIASYVNRPIVALFGPTRPQQYGPWSDSAHVIKKSMLMKDIRVNDVLEVLQTCL